MKWIISLFILCVSAAGQGTVSQVNCPNPYVANQIILVQAVHANPYFNTPAIVLGCYQMDAGVFTINNATTPPTVTLAGGVLSNGVIVNFADEETPSGTINGSNNTFTLAHSPTGGSLKIYRNGLRLKITIDYTLSSSTITFVTQQIPQTSDILVCDYRY